MDVIKVLIVQKNPTLAQETEDCLLKIGYEIHGTSPSLIEVVNDLTIDPPTIILLDIDTADSATTISLAGIVKMKYNIPIVYLTEFATDESVALMKKGHPQGQIVKYILKPFDERNMKVGIEMGLHNHKQHKSLASSQLSLFIINKKCTPALSEREFEVLQWMYDGKDTQEIASLLYVSANTIRTHIANIYLKLEVNSRAAAIAKVREWSFGEHTY